MVFIAQYPLWHISYCSHEYQLGKDMEKTQILFSHCCSTISWAFTVIHEGLNLIQFEQNTICQSVNTYPGQTGLGAQLHSGICICVHAFNSRFKVVVLSGSALFFPGLSIGAAHCSALSGLDIDAALCSVWPQYWCCTLFCFALSGLGIVAVRCFALLGPRYWFCTLCSQTGPCCLSFMSPSRKCCPHPQDLPVNTWGNGGSRGIKNEEKKRQ